MASYEKLLENRFVKWAKEQDIMPVKGPVATSKGFADRIVILPKGGGTLYIEFKGSSVSYDLTPLQEWWKENYVDSAPHRYYVVEDEASLKKAQSVCMKFINQGELLTRADAYALKQPE